MVLVESFFFCCCYESEELRCLVVDDDDQRQIRELFNGQLQSVCVGILFFVSVIFNYCRNDVELQIADLIMKITCDVRAHSRRNIRLFQFNLNIEIIH